MKNNRVSSLEVFAHYAKASGQGADPKKLRTLAAHSVWARILIVVEVVALTLLSLAFATEDKPLGQPLGKLLSVVTVIVPYGIFYFTAGPIVGWKYEVERLVIKELRAKRKEFRVVFGFDPLNQRFSQFREAIVGYNLQKRVDDIKTLIGKRKSLETETERSLRNDLKASWDLGRLFVTVRSYDQLFK